MLGVDSAQLWHTHYWVLHPGFPNKIIGEARAGINNKSRSHYPEIVFQLKNGQQFIFFRKILRKDTPLIFPNDTNIEPIKMFEAVIWASGNSEKWVRWPSVYLQKKCTPGSTENLE